MTLLIRLALLLALTALPLRAEVPIRAVTSPGGLEAWLVEAPDIPFTALEIRFRGGTSLDAPGKGGAAKLMAGLIEEGTGDLDAQGFAAARDALAADFRFSADRDSISVSARFLTENRDEALDLLRRALVEPRFDADAIERVRGQLLANIRADARDPQALAGRAFARLAFGNHPYGRPGDGTEETAVALTRDDVIAAHRGALARDRLHIAAVGDITAAELGPLLDTLLGGLPEAGAPLPPRAEVRLTGGVTVEPFPGPQSVILFGHEGIARDDPDFFAAFVLTEVLGGSRFVSRLMTELREKRGLTYGAYAYLAGYELADLVTGRLMTANATAAEALEVLRDEWARIASEGVGVEELDAAKTYLTGAYPLRFDGNGPIARILVGMQMQGMPIDYPATRNAKIEAVTLDDARRVAARLFAPERLHFVVVGTPEGDLESAGGMVR